MNIKNNKAVIYEKYTDPVNPGAFSGLSGFKKNNKELDKKLVEETLKQTLVYTSHKPKRKTFKRLKVQVSGPFIEFQCDLVEMQGISGSNFGIRYIFTAIDVFSKKGYGVNIKNKEAVSCRNAFKQILDQSKKKPEYIYVDNGMFLFYKKLFSVKNKN